jgi:hypothetical protein
MTAKVERAKTEQHELAGVLCKEFNPQNGKNGVAILCGHRQRRNFQP